MGKRNLSSENLSQAFLHILDEKFTGWKKSDFKSLKKDSQNKDEPKSLEKRRSNQNVPQGNGWGRTFIKRGR